MLEAVLHGFGGRLAARRLDRGLEGLEQLRLLLDQGVHGLGRVGDELELGRLRRGLPADRRDLLDEPGVVLELRERELAELVGVGLELEADDGPGRGRY